MKNGWHRRHRYAVRIAISSAGPKDAGHPCGAAFQNVDLLEGDRRWCKPFESRAEPLTNREAFLECCADSFDPAAERAHRRISISAPPTWNSASVPRYVAEVAGLGSGFESQLPAAAAR